MGKETETETERGKTNAISSGDNNSHKNCQRTEMLTGRQFAVLIFPVCRTNNKKTTATRTTAAVLSNVMGQPPGGKLIFRLKLKLISAEWQTPTSTFRKIHQAEKA